MRAAEALGRLRALGVGVLTTTDAAVALALSVDAASHVLRRLEASGIVTGLRRGVWLIGAVPDPLTLVEHLSAPHLAYVSLQTALSRRGLTSQIPALVYAVTLGRTRRIATPAGVFSLHHIPPELFGGFEFSPESGLKLATAEKALVDLLYLSGTRSRRMSALPEIELPRSFSMALARRWIGRVPSARLRTMVERRFAALCEATSSAGVARTRR